MTMKPKRNQITCRCPAYPFPHRQGGGRCTLPVVCYFYCFDCDEFDNCKEANAHPYDDREEAFTDQERNPSFRTW